MPQAWRWRVGGARGNAVRHQRELAAHLDSEIRPAKALESAAFVAVQVAQPVALASTPAPVALCLHARLPNGVALDVGQVPLEAMVPVLQLLGTLACSR